MTEQATSDAVRRTVTVPLSQARAFELFVDEFGEWWPKNSQAGAESEWGRVLVVERPRRTLHAWQLSPRFEFDPDPALATEVEVTFEPQGDARTSVTLEHRGFDLHGEAGPGMRDSVSGEGGWTDLLGLYADRARE
jgi:hypothetical protein